LTFRAAQAFYYAAKELKLPISLPKPKTVEIPRAATAKATNPDSVCSFQIVDAQCVERGNEGLSDHFGTIQEHFVD
jgi:hypothetical protein